MAIEKLKEWEKLRFGMFIHFGMSTFDGDDLSKGDKPSEVYAPDKLDVEQWILLAKEARMKYAVLTAKHVSGHCLWPTAYNDYHVGSSGNTVDVVGEFVKYCRIHGIVPGLYYCSWDNHSRFGSLTPTDLGPGKGFTTQEYRDFQLNQLRELLTSYGAIGEIWIDIPFVLPRDFRHRQYSEIAKLQPDAVIVANNCLEGGYSVKVDKTWPTDVLTLERILPESSEVKERIYEIEGKKYYIPAEVCDTVGKAWFWDEGDKPKSDGAVRDVFNSYAKKSKFSSECGSGQAWKDTG